MTFFILTVLFFSLHSFAESDPAEMKVCRKSKIFFISPALAPVPLAAAATLDIFVDDKLNFVM